MTSETDAVGALEAAETVGAPLSELSRLLMRHEPTMDITVPGWVADQVACTARRWGLAEPVAGACLLADGTARLVNAAEAHLLNWRTPAEALDQLLHSAPQDSVATTP